MKTFLEQLNPAFDHRNRLAIMALLAGNEQIDYMTLRHQLQLTDGNLASHLRPLESNGYILIRKTFVTKKTQTTYTLTDAGRKALKAHLDALEGLIAQCREAW